MHTDNVDAASLHYNRGTIIVEQPFVYILSDQLSHICQTYSIFQEEYSSFHDILMDNVTICLSIMKVIKLSIKRCLKL